MYSSLTSIIICFWLKGVVCIFLSHYPKGSKCRKKKAAVSCLPLSCHQLAKNASIFTLSPLSLVLRKLLWLNINTYKRPVKLFYLDHLAVKTVTDSHGHLKPYRTSSIAQLLYKFTLISAGCLIIHSYSPVCVSVLLYPHHFPLHQVSSTIFLGLNANWLKH